MNRGLQIVICLAILGVLMRCASNNYVKPVEPVHTPAAVASPITQASPAAKAEPAAEPKAKWDYVNTVDIMSGAKEQTATIRSEESLDLDFPYQGINHGVLQIRRNQDGLNVIVGIGKGQIICRTSDCKIKVRFDDDQPVFYTGTGPADHGSTVIFLSPEGKFLKRAKTAKKILIELVLYQAGSNVLTFDTAGLKFDQPERLRASEKNIDLPKDMERELKSAIDEAVEQAGT